MAEVSAGPDTAKPVLTASAHPIQACGAWSVAVLADRPSPQQVTPADLDVVAARITEDLYRAATAPKDDAGAGYAWWREIFMQYPNSTPAHTNRGKKQPSVLRDEIAAMLAPALPGRAAACYRCTFCRQDADILWSKANLPMFDTHRYINNLPPGLAGWPVCRPCRVAMWAVLYGAWLEGGHAVVLECSNFDVQRAFTAANVKRTAQLHSLDRGKLPAGAPELVLLRALVRHAQEVPASARLISFRSDNQEPRMSATSASGQVSAFLVLLFSDAVATLGWRTLAASLHRRDAASKATRSGEADLARLLFTTDGPSAALPVKASLLASHADNVSLRQAQGLHALTALYAKELFMADHTSLKPVTELLVAWITVNDNPRGRYNDFTLSCLDPYKLQRLLNLAEPESMRRGYGHDLPDLTHAKAELIQHGQNRTVLRALLLSSVSAELRLRGFGPKIGAKDDSDQDTPDEAFDAAAGEPDTDDEGDYA
jgi:CRISPR-associated protein Cst1